MKMNREVFFEGWLVKSPPDKRIWRARWRRRWFTLKQGELPGQFFLEYYTDRNCRKQKGVIDLDQVEQVDAGLRMNSAKHKLPFMFDVRTPNRTYYLAADTEEELKGWVNCICQVCGLQDLTRQGDDRHYFNIGPNCPTSNASNASLATAANNSRAESNVYCVQQMQQLNDASCLTETTDLNTSLEQSNNSKSSVNQLGNQSIHNTYQNDDFLSLRNSEYSNRETLVCDARFNGTSTNAHHTISSKSNVKQSSASGGATPTTATAGTSASTSGNVKKIPENLVFTENINDFTTDNIDKPSPSLSTCSGPYIPISECYSGSPALPPSNLLNSLDPRFYDTPKNHNINIGLNLTDDQPYSPKRNNCPQALPASSVQRIPHVSGHSSPTDSESVFTDDEWSQTESLQGTIDRRLRPSESSVENDSVPWTYVQRFSRVPNDVVALPTSSANPKGDSGVENPPPRPPKRLSALIFDEVEKSKDIQTSDTENASPAIGPKDNSSYVEQSYDIPRSHHLPYYLNNNGNGGGTSLSPKLITSADITAQSTPNLVLVDGYVVKQNFYTNAAPRKVEGSVFRYDFIEQGDAPAVNRNLKPKGKDGKIDDSSSSLNDSTSSNKEVPVSIATTGTLQKGVPPPNVDRKLKPNTPKFDTNSMRRRPNNQSINLGDNSDDDMSSLHSFSQMFFTDRNPHNNTLKNNDNSGGIIGSSKSEDKLQYLDLDHSANLDTVSTQLNTALQSAASSGTLKKTTLHGHGRSLSSAADISTGSSLIGGVGGGSGTISASGTLKKMTENSIGTVYKTVDFLKTEAFKRTRQDVEMIRANNRLKE